MAQFIGIGEKALPGKKAETFFINLDQICRLKLVNPVSHTDSPELTAEVTFTDGKTFTFGGEVARTIFDYVVGRMIEQKAIHPS